VRFIHFRFHSVTHTTFRGYQALHIRASRAHLDDPLYARAAWASGGGNGFEGRDGEGVGCAEGESAEVFEGPWGQCEVFGCEWKEGSEWEL